ncbi:hypothetical protein AB0K15_46555 [Amycolatopsis sp. NPDC049253]|uniref:phage distal tail protein n=1 Tax=Amycolatopsis sp. NPDC049253 TaxID=3155274 RepID=UPI0034362C01
MPTQVILPVYTIGSWSANADDDFGCRWVIEPDGASFITDGLGRKTHNSERPFGSGAYRSRSYPAARSGALQGWCDAGTREARVAARKRLMSVFPDGGQALLVVDDGIDPQQITVELDAGVPRCAVWADGAGFGWQLPLYAADGRLLSTTERSARATLATGSTDGLDWANGGLDWANGGLDWGSSGSNNVLALANSGTATTWPLLTVTTPSSLQNPAWTDPVTGGVLAYTGTIVAGQTLRIDCSPFTTSPVTLDGIDRTGALGAAKFISLPPGSSRAIQFTGVGAGTTVATWRDANN